MFKVGQVWRSKRTGILYVCDSCVKGYPPLFKRIGGGTRSKPIGHRQLTLIGNNYQERSTEPARPGTAFKRWLGEMTSGIPEQRGCRKEDC